MEMMQTTFTAALTSLNGISLGSSGGGSENGTIDGSNTAGCGGGAVAAISAPTGGVLTGKAFRESSLIGSPKISYQGSTAEAVSNSRIAWAEIVRPDGRPSAGFTVRGNFSNPSPWPASDGRWHIIRVLNDGQQVLKLPNGVGRGMLIVAGDLEIKGATTWEGIILAGGRLTFAGGARSLITGAVVTGLNYETRALNALPRGDFQLDDSNLSGAVDITYSSCAISRAVAAAGTLRPVSRTWVNTLPSY
jgi:hypothetical protein